MSESTPEQLKAFVAGRDVPCPGCGYNLRDLTATRCPEWGDHLALAVGVAAPRQAAFINGLIALAAGAGMNGLLLVYLLIRVAIDQDSFGFGDNSFSTVNLAGLMIEGTVLLVWLRRWRLIRRLSNRRKWLLVLGCWLITVGNLLFFTLYKDYGTRVLVR